MRVLVLLDCRTVTLKARSAGQTTRMLEAIDQLRAAGHEVVLARPSAHGKTTADEVIAVAQAAGFFDQFKAEAGAVDNFVPIEIVDRPDLGAVYLSNPKRASHFNYWNPGSLGNKRKHAPLFEPHRRGPKRSGRIR